MGLELKITTVLFPSLTWRRSFWISWRRWSSAAAWSWWRRGRWDTPRTAPAHPPANSATGTISRLHTIYLAILRLDSLCMHAILQLGQPSVNPPRLVLEVGGTSTLQAAMPVKLKSPPLQASKWGGDFSSPGMAACLVEVPPTSSTSLGGFTLGWPSCKAKYDLLTAPLFVHNAAASQQLRHHKTLALAHCLLVATDHILMNRTCLQSELPPTINSSQPPLPSQWSQSGSTVNSFYSFISTNVIREQLTRFVEIQCLATELDFHDKLCHRSCTWGIGTREIELIYLSIQQDN